MTDTLDFRTDMYEGFKELTYIINESEIEMINDQNALWQAIDGEIKTPYGVVRGINQENYGCRIWSVIGQGLTTLTIKACEGFVGELAYNYPKEVNMFQKVEVQPYGKSYLKIKIEVDSIYGFFTGITYIATPIRNPIESREYPTKLGKII